MLLYFVVLLQTLFYQQLLLLYSSKLLQPSFKNLQGLKVGNSWSWGLNRNRGEGWVSSHLSGGMSESWEYWASWGSNNWRRSWVDEGLTYEGCASTHLFSGVTETREDWFRWCYDNWTRSWYHSGFTSDVSEAGKPVSRGRWDHLGFVSTKEVCLKNGRLLNKERV